MARAPRKKIPKQKNSPQLSFPGMGPKTPFETIENMVIERLVNVRKNRGRIKVLEKQARGFGLGSHLSIGPRVQLTAAELMHYVHVELSKMPEYMYLTSHEQDLVQVFRAYLHDRQFNTIYEGLAAIRAVKADDDEDKEKLTELCRRIAKALAGIQQPPRVTDAGELAAARADARADAEVEMQQLLEEEDIINTAVLQLGYVDEEYEQLVRMRFLDGKGPVSCMVEMGLSEATFHRKQKKAIGLLALYLGYTG